MEGGLQEREETLGGGNGGSMSVHGLHQAAANGDVAEMRRLVATGVDVNEQGVGGPTALHAAASNGHRHSAWLHAGIYANTQSPGSAGTVGASPARSRL